MSELGLPLVSVIVLNYNYGRFLSLAVESVLAQSYPNIETIIVDDKSTDDSRFVIERIVLKHPSIKRVMLPRNVGQAKASREGNNVAGGSYLIFLDADDQILPLCVESHIFAHLHSRIPVAFTSVDVVNCVRGQDVNFSQVGTSTFIMQGSGRNISAVRPTSAGNLFDWYNSRAAVISPDQFHFVPPLHADPWVWAPSSAICYRRDAVCILMDECNIDNVKWIDTYFVRTLSTLFGSIIIDSPLMRYVTHDKNFFTKGAPLNNFLMFDPAPEIADSRALTRVAVQNLLQGAERYGARYPSANFFFRAIEAICKAWPSVDDGEIPGFQRQQLILHRECLVKAFSADEVALEFKRLGISQKMARLVQRGAGV